MLRRHFIINTKSSIPNNEIWYTSVNGNIIDPNDNSVFGVNIVSNTYEDNKGIITFDGDVKSIGDYAFVSNKSLTSITIPNSVTSIGVQALAACTILTSVTYKGTKVQWNAITKGVNWKYLAAATYVQCTDGQVKI